MLTKKLIAILCCACILTAMANTNLKTTSKRLNLLTNKILIAQKNLQAFQEKGLRLKGNLEQTEKNIGQLVIHLSDTKKQLSSQKKLLDKIQTQQARNQAKLNLQQSLLDEQTRALYFLGRQPYLKIILNQQDPVKISRYLHYYAALNQARLNVISSIKQITTALIESEKKANQQTQQLKLIQQKQQTQHDALKQEEQLRKNLLQQTNQSIQTQSEQLTKLLNDKKQLENIISALQQQQILGYSPGAQFQEMKHKLLWPIDHTKVIQNYGAPIAYGRLKATGILLKANEGEPIHAIFPGKVIFANWLNGFGLLTIIQHGKNYMTLYARNQSLYVKKDDQVKTGQIIATAGNSGGFSSPALYFEIRYKGKPLNPLDWLHH